MKHVSLGGLDVSRLGLGAMSMSSAHNIGQGSEAESTKFGLVSYSGGGTGVLDSNPTNIRTAVEGSLKRLNTDHIDLYYQHRVDPKTPIEEVAGAVKRLVSPTELPAGDWRNGNPRFTEETWEKNRHILDEIVAIAAEAEVTPAQVALAWVVAQGDNIATIPGTTRVAHVEENTAADQVTLSTQQLERLSSLSEAVGDRYSPADMSSVDR